MLGWTGDYGDPDSFYYAHFGPGATSDIGNWKNARVFELLNKGRATGDRAARAKIYAEVDKILSNESLRLPIVHAQPLLAKRKTLMVGFPVHWVVSRLMTLVRSEVGVRTRLKDEG